MSREIKFEYGFESSKGIIKKVYHLHEIPNIEQKCDVWDELPIKYVRGFTGLKDKNGNDIYEGDIVKEMQDDWSFTDGWGQEDPRWQDEALFNPIPQIEKGKDVVTLDNFRYWLKNESFGWEGEGLIDSSDCIIIGNIHENPELLISRE